MTKFKSLLIWKCWLTKYIVTILKKYIYIFFILARNQIATGPSGSSLTLPLHEPQGLPLALALACSSNVYSWRKSALQQPPFWNRDPSHCRDIFLRHVYDPDFLNSLSPRISHSLLTNSHWVCNTRWLLRMVSGNLRVRGRMAGNVKWNVPSQPSAVRSIPQGDGAGLLMSTKVSLSAFFFFFPVRV